MKDIKRKETLQWMALPVLLLLCSAPLFFCGCTREAWMDCPRNVDLSIRVVNVEGEDITGQGVIKTLSLYIFDNRQQFLRIVHTRVEESLRIYFPDQDTLHIVSWGNLDSGRQQFPQLTVGTPMSEAIVQLNPAQVAGMRATSRVIAQSPDDLFYSYDIVSLKSGEQSTYRLQMNRAVGSLSVTMRNLQSYANRYDDRYSLLVRETYNGIDFYGRLTGNKVGYLPATTFNEKQEFIAPLFNLLPSHAEGVIEIDVYHDSELITTVKKDSDGRLLKVLRGQVLNVLVNFSQQVEVEVSITPWGITQVWKEF